MVFNVLLYISLGIFILGLIYKVYAWFSLKIGISAQDYTPSQRFSAAVKGTVGVIFSSKILRLIKAFILDVVMQKKILKEDFLRWMMHMLLYGGFMLLLLMHALENFISAKLFSDYYSTVNPFMFLRDLFGFMVVIGIGIAIFRRFVMKVPRLKTSGMDVYAIFIVVVIIFSGILLEGVKITSHSEFQAMVEDYAGLDEEDDAEEIEALESYWVEKFDVVSPNVQAPFDEDILEAGLESHEANCAECHSRPGWAFTGYAVAKTIKPFALTLDNVDTANILWYIHFLACFIGLAYLPFSKMFHIISTPVSLLANAVMEKETADPANIVTRQAMELDACTHCGTCSLRCSASTSFDVLGNEYILPAEKMTFLKTLAKGKDLSDDQLDAIQEGVYLCTNCDRCTVVCPSGINLKELWFNVREDLLQRGRPEMLTLSPFSFYRGLNRNNIAVDDYYQPIEAASRSVACNFEQLMDKTTPISLSDTERDVSSQLPGADTFTHCFGCQTCTTVCPVVMNYENPQEVVGLLPHQIMNCLGLGLTEMATGTQMLWDCLTCYQCQEHCPQNVKVTDVLYDLKNLSIKNACMPSKEASEVSESASIPLEEDVAASEEFEESKMT
ncbi:MAG: 4Fe-4S dicluster domain-containing protein [Deltaproteobacteria bacterium]|jgi:heterodisulfide reductase subunit C|nr:4Fe-4S dicluster domain-containing protein [Deltaproteobacteria bacterium]